MADVSISLDLQAKQLYDDLQRVQTNFAGFASRVTTAGERAGKGFSGGFSGALTGLKTALGGVLGGLGVGLGIGAIVNKFEQVIEKGSRIHDIAAKFHIDAEQLQLIGNAAEQDGVSLDRVAAALNMLQINGAKAAKEGSPMAEALGRLKVNADAFFNASPAEKFFLLGEAWQKSAKGQREYADVAALIGKRNTDLIQTLERSRTEIDEMAKSMGIISTSSVNALDRAGDSIAAFNNRVTKGFAEAVGTLEKFDAQCQVAMEKFKKFLIQTGIGKGKLGDFEGGGGAFEGKGAGSSWADNVAPKEDMIAEAVSGTASPYSATSAPPVKDNENLTPAQRYLREQGFSEGAQIDLKRAAELQLQKEAFDRQFAQPGDVGGAAGGMEVTAPTMEGLLTEIRDNTENLGANI